MDGVDTVEGVVERITFHSEETGYTVLRLRPARARAVRGANREGLLTVVGNLPKVNPGESLRVGGAWANHPKHGLQFKADSVEQVLPSSVEGIRRYLGSGLVKGIGPKMAERIVKKFGEDTLRVIEEEPQRLLEVLDIGKKRVKMITTAWAEQRAIKNVMIFLQGHGVSTSLAVKIFKQYGDESEAVVSSDPYRLARDIWGIGFKTADKIAQNLGLPPDAPTRIEAGVTHALNEAIDDGHVYMPVEPLARKTADLLGVKMEDIAPAIERLHADERVKRETLQYLFPGNGDAREAREEQAVYLTPFYYGELGVSNRLRRMAATRASRLSDMPARPLDWLLAWAQAGVQLSSAQQDALGKALTHKVSVITGGPGTGKTTCLRTLIRALEASNHTFALASPTGRAAKRLAEATGKEARTIHRMLGYQPAEGFKHNENNPLEVDMLVVDEASMIDLLLMNHLLKALPDDSHLLLVGDIDQLPSVGAGDVLGDIIRSGVAAVTRLEVIFRQAQDSLIITNAHRINRGELPLTPKDARDFFMFRVEDPEKAADWVVDIVQNRVPDRFGFDAVNDIQVMAPMYRGAAGVANLNKRLQEALNPPGAGKPERRIGGALFRVGDKVMQVRNNYDKDVFNGDIGRVRSIDLDNARLEVEFDAVGGKPGRAVAYDWTETDELTHAFAISTHKAQGSEYRAVVMPVLTQHYMMLQRNLLYTAVTRARELCVLVGTNKALAMAVRNNKVAQRHSGLEIRLREA
ncbi:MAG: ATP-dependent RecD-like DNA helicase [Anaerolineales bacterium]